VLGDQQAALFGQGCFSPGEAKATYGTGSFILLNSGRDAPPAADGLLSTVAWGIGDRLDYALEGSVFVAGAAVQWLRDGLGLIESAAETERLATSVDSTEGVHFVPALTGLGSPWWDPDARGTITGITRGTRREHLVRATLEGIAFQVADAIAAMVDVSGFELGELRADGGASANDFLMAFQADLLGVALTVPEVAETTALGAALAAGVGVGAMTMADAAAGRRVGVRHEPRIDSTRREELLAGWREALAQARLTG
jgi:glycerol kinase